MDTEWTTVSKRNNKATLPAPKHTYTEEYVQDIRTNKVYAKREFPAGVTVSRPLEPIVSKGSVFSSRLRQEVEQHRVAPIPTSDIRDTVNFEASKVVKPSPYKNAALNAVKQEKVRQANAAIAATSRSSEFTAFQNIPIIRLNRSAPLVVEDEYDEHEDQGFDDDDDAIKVRRKRVQPTDKFQSVSRLSRVTTIYKSAIDIIEPEDEHPNDHGTEQPDYE
jgi:hypothetical protein